MYSHHGSVSTNYDLQSRITQALMDLMKGAQKAEIDVARSFMFLDTAVTFPTAAGLPLRLAVNGTTTVALGLESQMTSLMNYADVDLRMRVSPFAVTQLSAAMTIEIGVVKTGIKMSSTIHSSMAAELTVTRKAGSLLEVRFDLPHSKITLLDFKSNLLRIYKSGSANEINQKLTIKNSQM